MVEVVEQVVLEHLCLLVGASAYAVTVAVGAGGAAGPVG
jgi:hypothetical protein